MCTANSTIAFIHTTQCLHTLVHNKHNKLGQLKNTAQCTQCNCRPITLQSVSCSLVQNKHNPCPHNTTPPTHSTPNSYFWEGKANFLSLTHASTRALIEVTRREVKHNVHFVQTYLILTSPAVPVCDIPWARPPVQSDCTAKSYLRLLYFCVSITQSDIEQNASSAQFYVI